MVEIYQPMKAPRVLIDNILALLDLRHRTQHDLASYCHYTDVWLSYILSEKRGFPLDELDRVADFFGVEPYQLFQPGISRNSERRISERRVGKDRRLSANAQAAADLHARLAPSQGGAHGGAAATLSTTPPAIVRLLHQHEREMAALWRAEERRRARKSRRQTPPPRKARTRKSA